MALVIVGLVCAPIALAVAPGTSTVVKATTENYSATNVSIAGANGDIWYAIESVDLDAFTEPRTNMQWWDVSGSALDGKVLQAYGLIASGIYPSALTWGGATNLLVSSKIDPDLDPTDPNTGEPHVWLYEQDRDDMSSAAVKDELVEWSTPNSAYEHGRPQLGRDPEEPELYACWTAKETGGSDENVFAKAKDTSDWTTSTLRNLSASSDEEDHCFMDFNYDGTRYTAYHRDQLTGDDIGLEITSFVGGTWTVVGEFPLDNSANCDRPSLWSRNTTTTSTIAIVADCGPTSTSKGCDS